MGGGRLGGRGRRRHPGPLHQRSTRWRGRRPASVAAWGRTLWASVSDALPCARRHPEARPGIAAGRDRTHRPPPATPPTPAPAPPNSTPLRTLGDLLSQRLDAAATASAAVPDGTPPRRRRAVDLRHVAASAVYGGLIMGESRGGWEAGGEGVRRRGGACAHARPDAPTPTPAPTSTPLTHLVSGPVGHVWYRRLDSFVSARVKRGSAAFVAAKASQEREKKETGPGRPGGAGAARGASPTLPPHTSPFLPPQVGLDEAVFGPVHVAGYFAAVVAAAGGGVADVQAKARRDGWSGGVGWAGVRGPPAGPGHAKPALSARGRPCPTTRAFTPLKKPSRQTLALTPLALTPLAITPLALTPLAFTNPDTSYTLAAPLTQPLTTQPSHHTLCTHPVRFHPTLCPPTSRSSPFGPRFRPSIFGAFPCGIR